MTGRPSSEATARDGHALGHPLASVIGLEVHCQLATQTKLFCGCTNSFGARPNQHTCPVCTGQPGTLPAINSAAVALAVRTGLALGCDVAHHSRFDRKNYFYCDLPKGFQTTQYAHPICLGGSVPLDSGRVAQLTRIHLEEDAGKAIHDRGTRTCVDLNRAGIPLIEIVGEPDLRSAAEAKSFLASLREILRYLGTCDGDMEKGSLRCDVNISVRSSEGRLGTRVEIKNLNSMRHVGEAIEFEVARQTALIEGGDTVRQETRLWDPVGARTQTMRSKENEDDYRYFPEPDLPPVILDEDLLRREAELIPELPAARRARYVAELGLSEYDAGVLTSDRALADYFEECARLSGSPKSATNWITNELLAALGDDAVPGRTLAELRVTPESLAELISLTEGGTLHTAGARTVLEAMLRSGRRAAEVVGELGLEQITDTKPIEDWCRAALAENPQVIAQVRDGKTKALGALIGPILKRSEGRANPGLVRETLQRLIADSPPPDSEDSSG